MREVCDSVQAHTYDIAVDGPRFKPRFGGSVSPARRAERMHEYGREWWRLRMQPKAPPSDPSAT